MATFPDGRENIASESGFAEFEDSNFSSAGALHRTSSMPDDDSPRSPLSNITHLFLCNINGSAAAMEPSFGNAIALHSPSWGGGRRGGQRYYTAHRSSSRITESPIFCWASDENLHAESPEYYLCSTASSCKRNDYPNNLIELKVNLKNKLRG